MDQTPSSLIRRICRRRRWDRTRGYRHITRRLQSWPQRIWLSAFRWALREHDARWHELAVDVGSCTRAEDASEICRWWRRRLPAPLRSPGSDWLLRTSPGRLDRLFRNHPESGAGGR